MIEKCVELPYTVPSLYSKFEFRMVYKHATGNYISQELPVCTAFVIPLKYKLVTVDVELDTFYKHFSTIGPYPIFQ